MRFFSTIVVFSLIVSNVAAQGYRRIEQQAFGSPAVMTMVKKDVLPEPGPGEVRIKVITASASFTDIMVRKGIYTGVGDDFPLTPGYDLIGVIDKLGDGVDSLKEGQHVAALTVTGAYTEYAVRPTTHLVPISESIDPVAAVSLILSYTTAYQMLHRTANLKAGHSVLIHGASGAVGMALAQLAKLKGLKMYGTASTAKQAFISSLGVIPIDYKTENFVERIMTETSQQGVDVVFDAVSVDNFERSFSVLKPGGKLVTYGFYSRSLDSKAGESFGIIKEFMRWQWLNIKWNKFPNEDRSAEFYSITGLRDEHPDWFKEDLISLFDLLEKGEIKPNIWKVLPLEKAQLAHEMIESGQVKGKIVLTVN